MNCWSKSIWPIPKRVLKSYPHQLSGGQQQRIGIAMAFACRPRLIVLDEPTTGLDVSTQRHVLDTVADLSTQYGATIVYVSHDLAVVGQIADETAVMYAGRLVEKGPTESTFRGGAPSLHGRPAQGGAVAGPQHGSRRHRGQPATARQVADRLLFRRPVPGRLGRTVVPRCRR